jgi:hypothetical protein
MPRGARLLAGVVTAIAWVSAVPAALSIATAAPSSSTDPTWHRQRVPSHGLQSQLFSVDAIRPADAWAVGYYIPSEHDPDPRFFVGLTEHWDGASWRIVDAAPGLPAFLTGVTAVSSDDVWAVGLRTPGPGQVSRTLAEHWDGTGWTVVPTPSPGARATLTAAHARSSNDVWAVGSRSNRRGGTVTLIEHWDGAAWSTVSSPNLGRPLAAGAGNALTGVCGDASGVWAVGTGGYHDRRPLIVQLEGSIWTIESSGASEAPPAACAVAPGGDLWIVGQSGASPTRNLAERRRDGAWAVFRVPNRAGRDNALAAVSGTGPRSVWAVGTTVHGDERLEIQRWDGTVWRFEPAPLPRGESALAGVVAVKGVAFAVGLRSNDRIGPVAMVLEYS